MSQSTSVHPTEGLTLDHVYRGFNVSTSSRKVRPLLYDASERTESDE